MLRVALVGRPNVGKSALLNRLARRTVSIVHDQPGVTRDRISVMVRRPAGAFELIDTGGIGWSEFPDTPAEISRAVHLQAEIAIASANLILLVVDGLEGIRPLDREILDGLRKSQKPLWLIVNKLDLPSHEARATEFYELGVDPLYGVSASHGRGVNRLWEELEKAEGRRQKAEGGETEIGIAEKRGPRIAIVGRPNVGKSSLVNRLLGMERVIVSEVPGTTRDAVDLEVKFQNKIWFLMDTAGIRPRSKIRSSIESYSRHWSKKSIRRCDLALLVLDAQDGPTRQDREIAGLIMEHQKPCVILVNKWDLNETIVAGKRVRSASRSEYEKGLRMKMPFLHYAPVMFISALEGYHALGIWKEIEKAVLAGREVFTTGVLNRIFNRARERLQPPMRGGKRLKIYYGAQKTGAPVPTFILFINQKKLWVESYGRYLSNQIREEKALTGCPIVFELKEKSPSITHLSGQAKRGSGFSESHNG